VEGSSRLIFKHQRQSDNRAFWANKRVDLRNNRADKRADLEFLFQLLDKLGIKTINGKGLIKAGGHQTLMASRVTYNIRSILFPFQQMLKLKHCVFFYYGII
jgi:hypothetical protein